MLLEGYLPFMPKRDHTKADALRRAMKAQVSHPYITGQGLDPAEVPEKQAEVPEKQVDVRHDVPEKESDPATLAPSQETQPQGEHESSD